MRSFRRPTTTMPMQQRRHGARRDAVCRARAAPDPDRRQVLETLAQSHRTLGAYEIMDRLAATGPRPAPITVYEPSNSCSTTASSIASRAAMPSSPASASTARKRLPAPVPHLRPLWSGGRSLLAGGRRYPAGDCARRRLHPQGAGDRDHRNLRPLRMTSPHSAQVEALRTACSIPPRLRGRACPRLDRGGGAEGAGWRAGGADRPDQP